MGNKVRAEHYLQYLKHRHDVRMQEYDELQKNYAEYLRKHGSNFFTKYFTAMHFEAWVWNKRKFSTLWALDEINKELQRTTYLVKCQELYTEIPFDNWEEGFYKFCFDNNIPY